MSKLPFLKGPVLGAAVVGVSCSAPVAPDARDSRALASQERPRVFIEAFLVDVAAAEVGAIANASWDALAKDATFACMPNVLAEDGRTAEISLPTNAEAAEPKNDLAAALRGFSFQVMPHVRAGDRVEIDLALGLSGRDTPIRIHQTWLAGDGELKVEDIGVHAEGRRVVLFVRRPTIVRGEGDLRAIFTRKQQAARKGG